MITSFQNMTINVINSHSYSEDQKVIHARQKSSSRSKLSFAEDEKLRFLVSEIGEHNWHSISIRIPGGSTREESWAHRAISEWENSELYCRSKIN
jgi:type IV pilus biogenesis protein CpaD/CtpE